MRGEREALVERLRAIAGLVATHELGERDDARAVGLLRGIAFRLAEIDSDDGKPPTRAGWRCVMGEEKREPVTLGEALPAEMARVRDHVLPHYVEIGSAGMFGAMMIRADLDAAAKAMAEGDVVAMLAAYQALKETNA